MNAPNFSSGQSIARIIGNRCGQTLVEYALTLAFISVVAISVLIATGNKVRGVFTTIDSQLSTAQRGGAAAGTGSSGSQSSTSGG